MSRRLRIIIAAFTLCGLPAASSFAQDQTGGDFSDDELIELGWDFVDAMNLHDVDALADLIYLNAFGLRISSSIGMSPEQQSEFMIGFSERGVGEFASSVIETFQQTQNFATFLRVRDVGGVRGPLIRYYSSEGGLEYVVLAPERNLLGEVLIEDFFVGSNGAFASEAAGALSQLMLNPSESLLLRVFGVQAINRELLETVRLLGRYQRTGDFEAAYAAINRLPPEIRDHRTIAGMATQYAAFLDDVTYQTELARLARNHGDDPSAAFLLIDYYFGIEDYAAALRSTEALVTAFGMDGALGSLLSTIALMAEDGEAALGYARDGIATEPGFEDVYWALLSANLLTGRVADSIAALEILENRFGYIFLPEDFAGVAEYADFVQSPEYLEWVLPRTGELPAAVRDANGRIVTPGYISTFDAVIGDCFDDDPVIDSNGEFDYAGMLGVPCASNHDNEVYAIIQLSLESFPQSDDEMFDIASEECLQRFEVYVGRDYDTSIYGFFTLYPDRQMWTEQGQRAVVCALYDFDGALLTGSARGSAL